MSRDGMVLTKRTGSVSIFKILVWKQKTVFFKRYVSGIDYNIGFIQTVCFWYRSQDWFFSDGMFLVSIEKQVLCTCDLKRYVFGIDLKLVFCQTVSFWYRLKNRRATL